MTGLAATGRRIEHLQLWKTMGQMGSEPCDDSAAAAERLRQNEQKLRLAIEAANMGTWVLTFGTMRWDCDEAAQRLYNQPGPVGVHDEAAVRRILHPDDIESMWKAVAEACDPSGDGYYHTEYRVVQDDEPPRWISVWGRVEFDGEGPDRRPVRMIGTSLDITGRKATEENLRQSRQRFREVLENSLDAAYRRDLRGDCYDYLSPVIEELMGLSLQQMQSMSVEQFMQRIHPDDRQTVEDAIAEGMRTGCGRVEYRIRHSDGQYRWMADNFTVQYDDLGRPSHRGGIVRDVTEQKRTEEALRQARDELERRVRERTAELQERADQLARLTGELTMAEQRERRRLAQVLHDHLQQLLVGAKYSLDVLSRRVAQPQRDGVAQVESLIDDALAASRSLTMELSPPILHEAGLEAALHWLARWMHDKHRMTVDVEVADEAPCAREDVQVLLFQAVRELLFNVVKHSGVQTARVRMDGDGADRLRVSVRDDGDGFEPEALAQQVASSSAGGFGLFSIRERIALLGGALHIDSKPGSGAEFTLTVPATTAKEVDGETAEPATGAAAAAAAPARLTARKGSGGADSGRLRILLVDDHEVVRQGLRAVLSEQDDLITVGEAADGIEAIEQARRLNPDVILMDFSMPRMDGVEATRRIGRLMPHVRVIGLSIYEETDRAAAMLAAGASAYLSTSGKSDLLLQTIRSVCVPASSSPGGRVLMPRPLPGAGAGPMLSRHEASDSRRWTAHGPAGAGRPCLICIG